MKIYQLQTAKEFYESLRFNLTTEQLMQLYAEDVAKKFAAELVNSALGNTMEVSNSLHEKVESLYKSIEWK